jgi:hypothetical protein
LNAGGIERLGEGRIKFLCTGPGKEYTDNHLSMLLTEATQQYKQSSFQVVSKDKGYVPVVANLTSRGLSVELIKVSNNMLSLKELYK